MYHLFCLPVNFHIYHLKDTAVSIPVEWRWCWMHATLLLNFWCRTCLLDILSVIRLHLHASLMHWIYAVKQASLDVLVFLFMWFLTCRTKCCLMCYRQVLFNTFVFMLHFMCLPWSDVLLVMGRRHLQMLPSLQLESFLSYFLWKLVRMFMAMILPVQ